MFHLPIPGVQYIGYGVNNHNADDFIKLLHPQSGSLLEAIFMMKNGISPTTITDRGWKMYCYVLVFHMNLAAADLLFEAGIPVDVSADTRGYTPLMIACNQGSLESIKWLIDHGAGVNHKCNREETALTFVVRKGNKDYVEFLLDNGADPFVIDHQGSTLLHIASFTRGWYLLPYLRTLGIDENVKDFDGKTYVDYLKENEKQIRSTQSLYSDGDIDLFFETFETK